MDSLTANAMKSDTNTSRRRIGLALAQLAVLLAAAFLAAFLAAGVDAQSVDRVLVSNTGQPAGTALTTDATRDSFAQSFRTGGNINGYRLSSVDLGLSAAAGVTVEVSLWTNGDSAISASAIEEPLFGEGLGHGAPFRNHPFRRLVTLAGPSSIDSDTSTLEQFTTNGDVPLLHDRTYWIVVTKTAGASAGLSIDTVSPPGSVDAGGLDGFSLGSRVWARSKAVDPWSDDGDYANGSNTSMTIRVRGMEPQSRPPGPSFTTRHDHPWAATARTSTTTSKYAYHFLISHSGFVAPRNAVVTSVVLSVAAEEGVTPRVAIHADDNGAPAASPLADGTLISPSVSRDLGVPARAEFTARTPLILNLRTTYWVVLDAASGSGNLSVGTVESIVPTDLTYVPMQAYSGTTWSDDTDGRLLRMAVNGTTEKSDRKELFIGPPQRGVGLAPEIVDDNGSVHNESWQWQRGETSSGPFTDIPASDGGRSAVYWPSADDLGKWLKVTVTYDNAFGSAGTLSTVSPQPVLTGAALSNAGQHQVLSYVLETRSDGNRERFSLGQAFTTGQASLGYVLNGVRLGIARYTRSPYYSDAPSSEDSTTTTDNGDNTGLRVSFGASAYTVDESDNPRTTEVKESEVAVQLRLSEDPQRTVVIPIVAANLDGASSDDYFGVPGSVTFNSGETSKSFVIIANDDVEDDDGERIELGFGPLPTGVSAGATSTATVSIRDDDAIIDSLSWALHADVGGLPSAMPLFDYIGIPAADLDANDQTFEELIHPGFILEPDTKYWVVVRSELLVEPEPGDGALLQLAAITELARRNNGRLLFLYEAPVPQDAGSEPGWSLDVPAIASHSGGMDRDWIPHAHALELRGRSVLRMSVLADHRVAASFKQASYDVSESDIPLTTDRQENEVTVTVELDADPRKETTVPITTILLSGAAAEDYSGVPEQLVFAAGETSKSFTVTIADDSLYEFGEGLVFGFGELPDTVIPGDNPSARLNIVDDDQLDVSFNDAAQSVAEGAAQTVTVSLSADPERSVTVPIAATLLGGATEDDYSGAVEELTFTAGQTARSFTVLVTQDDIDDDDEGVRFSLGDLPAWARAGAHSSTTLLIEDDDDPFVDIEFVEDAFTVNEGGTAFVRVRLSADPERTVTIPIVTIHHGGATAADYSGAVEELVFEAGQTSQSFSLEITQDDIDDDDERVTFGLGTLPHRVNPGAKTEARVEIVDDDDPIIDISWVQEHYRVREGASVTVRVVLSADPERTVTIPINRTHLGGATNDDYSGVPDSVSLDRGETSRTFDFMAVKDSIADTGESVRLSFGALPERVNPGSIVQSNVLIKHTSGVFGLDCADSVWCANLSFADMTALDWGRYHLHYERNWDPASSLSTQGFGFRGLDYTVRRVELHAGTYPVQANTYNRFRQHYARLDIDITHSSRHATPPEAHYIDWVLHIDGVELAFSDALRIGHSTFRWYGVELQDLYGDWKSEQPTRIGIEESPLSQRPATPATPSSPVGIFLGPTRSDELSVTLRDIWWQFGGNQPTSYLLQWKRAADSWSDGDAVGQKHLGNGNSIQFTRIGGLTPHTPYTARVIPTNAAGDGPASEQALGRPQSEIPRLESTTVNGSTLTLNYNLPLNDDVQPAVTAFVVYAGSSPREVSAVAIDGRQVRLVLSEPVTAAHTVNTHYAMPVDSSAVFLKSQSGAYVHSSLGGNLIEAVNLTPAADLRDPTASFNGLPESHDGVSSFSFNVDFSEPVWMAHGTPRYNLLHVSGGTVTTVHWRNRKTRQWQVTIQPHSSGPIEVSLPADRICDPPDVGALCAVGNRPLSAEVRATVPGPTSQQQIANSPASGAPGIRGSVQVGETLTADTSGITDADGLSNPGYTYQWIRHDFGSQTDTEIAGETGRTYVVRPADAGKALQVRVDFTDDLGNAESLLSIRYAVAPPVVNQPSSRHFRPPIQIDFDELRKAILPEPEPDPGLSLSDFKPGAGQRTLASALIVAGERGRKDDGTRDRAWYATETNAWHASGELSDGSLAWNEITLTRVAYFSETGILRLNEADALHLGQSFASGGVNRELTIWVQTEGETVSFAARDRIVNAGSGWINFRVPQADRSKLAAIAVGDETIIAVTAPRAD